jgi:hypothetical protein
MGISLWFDGFPQSFEKVDQRTDQSDVIGVASYDMRQLMGNNSLEFIAGEFGNKAFGDANARRTVRFDERHGVDGKGGDDVRIDFGQSAGEPDLIDGVGETLMVPVREVGRLSVKTLEDEACPEFPGVQIMKGSDDDGKGGVEQEEFPQKNTREQCFFAQDEPEADYTNHRD